jgi:hypothetical protein
LKNNTKEIKNKFVNEFGISQSPRRNVDSQNQNENENQ